MDMSQQARDDAAKQGDAMPGGRYPILNQVDLEKAIRAVGRSKGGEEGRAQVRRFIMRRARALGLSKLVPDTWSADGSLNQ